MPKKPLQLQKPGILVEMENFNPTADTTRAEAAVMLYRLYEILLNLK